MPKKATLVLCTVVFLSAVSGCSFHRHSPNPDPEIVKLKQSVRQLQSAIDSLWARPGGAVAAGGTSREIEKIRTDIAEIRRSITDLQTARDVQIQTLPVQGQELNAEVIQVRQSQRRLEGQVDSLSLRFDQLLADRPPSSEMDRIKADIQGIRLALDELQGARVLPSSTLPEDTEQAPSPRPERRGNQTEVTPPGKSDADTVRAEISEYYVSGQFDQVVSTYQEFVTTHPEGRLGPATEINVAMAFKQLGRNQEYAGLLRRIAQDYAGTEQANIATELLDALPK